MSTTDGPTSAEQGSPSGNDRGVRSASRRSAVCSAAAMACLAMLLRWGSLDESFWVDELHSAWVVSGPLDQVAPRAALGNQSPWSFYLLWLWVQAAGINEWSLRLPAVLATATASAALVYAGTRCSRFERGSSIGSRSAGWLAGGLIAVDRNALFFGTEARGYAFVILAMALSIAVAWCAVFRATGRRPTGNGQSVGASSALWDRWYPALAAAASLMGVVVHITAALGIATWVAGAALAGTRTTGRVRRCWYQLARAAGAGLIVGLALQLSYAQRVWNRRDQWAAFGQTEALQDLWLLWPWNWLLIVPAAVVLMLTLVRTGRSLSAASDRSLGLLPACLCAGVGASVMAWGIAYGPIAPIWHRRFLIATFPPLATASAWLWLGAGLLIGGLLQSPRSGRPGHAPYAAGVLRSALPGITVITVLVGLTVMQGTAGSLLRGRTQLVVRGERWREAAAFVNQHRSESELVWVAAELLESQAWQPTPEFAHSPRARYLLYPLAGPYRVENAQAIGDLDEPRTQAWLREQLERQFGSSPKLSMPQATWLVVRRSQSRIDDWLMESLQVAEGELGGVMAESSDFGRVSVVRFSRASG